MGITNLIKKRAVFLKTGDATQYLNIRSLEISGQSLNLTGDKVRELAKSDKLKHNKTSENGNFLFKTSWLEKYLQSCFAAAYTGPEVRQERFVEYDVKQNMQADSNNRPEFQSLFSSANNQPQTPQTPPVTHNDDFLTRIKKSPPLIYLGALIVGFAAGSSTTFADRLIGMGYFSDRIAVANPIEESHADKIVEAIRNEKPDDKFAQRIRPLVATSKGPFGPVTQKARIILLDSEGPGDLATVCDSSLIRNMTITIKSVDTNFESQTPQVRQSLGKFEARLNRTDLCGSPSNEPEKIAINRQAFERKLNVKTDNKAFIDVDVIIAIG